MKKKLSGIWEAQVHIFFPIHPIFTEQRKSHRRAILVVKIVRRMKQPPVVKLCHCTCPLGQQSEAPQTHFHQKFVVGIRSWDARVGSEGGGHLRTVPEWDKKVEKVLFV